MEVAQVNRNVGIRGSQGPPGKLKLAAHAPRFILWDARCRGCVLDLGGVLWKSGDRPHIRGVLDLVVC